jgi:hypothetical protein
MNTTVSVLSLLADYYRSRYLVEYGCTVRSNVRSTVHNACPTSVPAEGGKYSCDGFPFEGPLLMYHIQFYVLYSWNSIPLTRNINPSLNILSVERLSTTYSTTPQGPDQPSTVYNQQRGVVESQHLQQY